MIKNIYKNIYYKFLNKFIVTKYIYLPNKLKEKRNIFLYFDYEREFGGHDTNINDSDIKNILLLLNKFQIKTTWYTVGEVLQKYPESVINIYNEDHEIGSHTFSHITPLYESKQKLRTDFIKYHNILRHYPNLNINGFHSPQGMWSINLIGELYKNHFLYDVALKIKAKPNKIHIIQNGLMKHSILRLFTLGDDWNLFKNKSSVNCVLNFYISLINNIRKGEVGGIGFHPWIISSNANIYKGFVLFLEYLSGNSDIYMNTAQYFVNTCLTNE